MRGYGGFAPLGSSIGLSGDVVGGRRLPTVTCDLAASAVIIARMPAALEPRARFQIVFTSEMSQPVGSKQGECS